MVLTITASLCSSSERQFLMTAQKQLVNEGKEAGKHVSLSEKRCDKLSL